MKVFKSNHGVLVLLLVLVVLFCSGVLEAVSLPLSNSNFESGSDNSTADSWTERSGESTGSVYFRPSQGDYSESGSITGRAASIMSTGTAYLQQVISGVQAGDYDTYRIYFDVGYRNDAYSMGNITHFRVSIWDTTNNVELAGEDITIGYPGVDNSQVPNVGMLVNDRRVVLNVDVSELSTEQVALRFTNTDITDPAYKATAVIDNVVIYGAGRVAHWDFENKLSDTFSNHDGTAYHSPAYTGKGIGGTSAISLNENDSDAVVVLYSSVLCPDTFTVTAWAKVSPSSSGAYRAVVSNRGSARGWTLYATSANKWSFWTSSGSAWISLDGPTVNEDEWCFLAVSFQKTGTSGSNVVGDKKLYVNGDLVASASGVVYRQDTAGTPFLIGAGKNEVSGYDYFFDGLIDDVRFHDYCLSTADIACMYSETVGKVCKVLSYNIHHGEGTDSVTSLSRIANVIRRTGADIICLQEVSNGYYGSTDQAAWLADELNMYYVFGPALDSTFGNAILSKYPFLSTDNYTLPIYSTEEKRACLVVNMELKGKMYTIVNTHLDHSTDEAINLEIDYILNAVGTYTGKKILTGDFNSYKTDPAFRRICYSFEDTYDRSISEVSSPSSRLDFVMVSHDFAAQVNRAEQVDNSLSQVASDHKPVLMEFMP